MSVLLQLHISYGPRRPESFKFDEHKPFLVLPWFTTIFRNVPPVPPSFNSSNALYTQYRTRPHTQITSPLRFPGRNQKLLKTGPNSEAIRSKLAYSTQVAAICASDISDLSINRILPLLSSTLKTTPTLHAKCLFDNARRPLPARLASMFKL